MVCPEALAARARLSLPELQCVWMPHRPKTIPLSYSTETRNGCAPSNGCILLIFFLHRTICLLVLLNFVVFLRPLKNVIMLEVLTDSSIHCNGRQANGTCGVMVLWSLRFDRSL